MRPKIAGIDLDGVLTTTAAGPYLRRDPDLEQIARLQALRARGWRITIWTSRPNGQIARIDTIAWLKRHRVPFDSLHMGKPLFDLLIDDCALPELPEQLEALDRALLKPQKLRNLAIDDR